MKLLILTQYFPPEVGAPQNRLFELAVRLQRTGVEITVLTAMPNYPQMEIYEGYKNKNYLREKLEGIDVHRSAIFASRKKTIINRLRNYFSFVLSSMQASRKLPDTFDFLLCESPPLFLGYSAMYLARKKKAKLIFNVSDLWPESAEKLNVVTNPHLLNLAYNLEAKLYRRSALVTGQTQGICRDIQARFPEVKTYWLPNGVDLDYYDPSKVERLNWRAQNSFNDSDFIALYAGIIGIAQGLEVILKAAERLKAKPNLKFVLMGSGPEKERLLALKNELDLKNVFFMEPVPKSKMPQILKSVNAAVIPLRKLELFLGAIPSKIFESLAMELPVILGVLGEARDLFIKEGNAGIYVEPENSEDLAKAVEKLEADPDLCRQLGSNGRNYVKQHFNREIIAAKFHERLLQLQTSVSNSKLK